MKYLVPRDQIEKLVGEMRSHGYEIFRTLSRENASFCDFKFHLPDSEITAVRVDKNSVMANKTLAEVKMRKDYEVTAFAVRRDGIVYSNPSGDTNLEPEDVLILFGPAEKIMILSKILNP